MIDCDKCVYRKNGKCGYKKEGCNYIPVDEPVIPMSVIEQIKAEIKKEMRDCAKTSIYTRMGFKTTLNIIDEHIKEYTE